MRSFIARLNDWLAPAIGRAHETDLGEGACERFIDEICDELDRDAESRDRTREDSSIKAPSNVLPDLPVDDEGNKSS